MAKTVVKPVTKVVEKQKVVSTGHKPKKAANQEADDQTDEAAQADTNEVGERVETPASEVDKVYVTSEGKHMIIHQVDDENGQVFAGEKGQNSKWYKNEVVNSWNELKPTATP